MTPRPEKIHIVQGGTEFGIHAYRDWNMCGRMAALKQEARGMAQSSSGNLLVGTYAHNLLAFWFQGGEIPDSDIRDSLDIESPEIDPFDHPGEWHKALALVEDFTSQNTRNVFGNVIAAEMQFRTYIAGAPFTGQIDLLTQVEEPSRISGYDVEPGHYIVDHKTAAAMNGDLIDRYLNDLQFTGYWLGLSQTQNIQAQGTFVNVMVKTRIPQYRVILVPPPSETEIRALENLICRAKNIDQDDTNPAACEGPYGKLCAFLLNGKCDRTSQKAPLHFLQVGRKVVNCSVGTHAAFDLERIIP